MKEYTVVDIVSKIEELGYKVRGGNKQPTEEDRELAIYSKEKEWILFGKTRATYKCIGTLLLGQEGYPINGFWKIDPWCTVNAINLKNHLEKNYNASIKIEQYEDKEDIGDDMFG